MRRRDFIRGIAGSAAAWSLAARAQQSTMPVIGYLSEGSAESDDVRLAGLRRGLAEAGHVEGRNVTIEYRWAANQIDQLPALVADLLQHRVAVIVTPGTLSTFAAKAATSTVPIVFVTGTDPVQLGLVGSLNQPGGNVTGNTVLRHDLSAKRLEMLHELLPGTASVGFLEDPRNPTAELETRELLAASRALGVKIQMLHVATEGEIDSAFASLVQARTGALLVPDEIFFNDRITQLVALAARYAVPTLYSIREFPLAGGLMSYGISRAETYRLIGLQVARILEGQKPADLPVMQSTKIELVINLKTAKALGVTIPPSLLARADEVIE
jgi:putative tryptophan/tyrosine transport system substrate-binding protein